jgi:transcriptional antiterminator RfaH
MMEGLQEKIWCLAQVKPNTEATAARNLRRQGFDVFEPKLFQTGRFRGRFRSEKKALFPGYLFVSLLSDFAHWRAISSTLGVSRLVSFGKGHPSIVPSAIVDLLRQRCEDSQAAPAERFNVGDGVRITSGPFSDFIGRLESIPSTQRVWILMDVMGRGQRISINVRDLQRAGS